MSAYHARFTKQPDDHLDYDIDLRDWMPKGDHVADVSVTTDSGITIASYSYTDENVKLWVKGGEDGKDYDVSVEVKTNEGRTKEFDLQMRVRERP